MTCIVGLEHEAGVLLGADSAGVAGWNITPRVDEKVFHVGPFVMGFTTSFRMGQILRYAFSYPDQLAEDDMTFMCTRFINEVRACLSREGFATKKDGQEAGGTFLVGYRGKLYHIADDFQVGRSKDGFQAVGCGESFALGCLHATESDSNPTIRVRKALEAAARFSGGVRGPFNFVEGTI